MEIIFSLEWGEKTSQNIFNLQRLYLGSKSCPDWIWDFIGHKTTSNNIVNAYETMKLNEDTAIFGRSVILVPYATKHVEKYHSWMQSDELLTLTSSEPLTIEEEYKMQKSWLHDHDKLTFIILRKNEFENTSSEVAAMVGDVNIFLNDHDNPFSAELELMIAEKNFRQQGLGLETALLMMDYCVKNLNIDVVHLTV